MINQISWILFAIPSILIASTVHEYAHAYSAYRLGDSTAKMNGRMTLNPLAHIDIIGAAMMALVGFGWSKPVPVNERNFDDPVKGTAITSFAGPASNLLLAIVTAFPLSIFNSLSASNATDNFFVTFLVTFMLVNISLAVFNLLPIPPLDGHKIVRAFLPANLRHSWENLERYGFIILLLLFLPFSPFRHLIYGILIFFNNLIFNLLIG